jgi:hypothetical protein
MREGGINTEARRARRKRGGKSEVETQKAKGKRVRYKMQNTEGKSQKSKARAQRIKTPAFLFRIAGEKYGKSARAV